MNTTCPICHSDLHQMVYRNASMDPPIHVVKCKQCNHLFTFVNAQVDQEAIYNDEVYQVIENRRSIFDKILDMEYNKVLRKLVAIHPQKGKLLDFGAGKGKFGNLAEKQGWEVKCVETSAPRAEYASSVYGLDVSTEYYYTGNIFNITFDVLTLFHVVEHLPEPFVLLKELINHNLNADAFVIIEVPNFKSYQSAIAKEKWMHLDVPRHLNHFTEERLESLISDLDLVIIKKSFFSLHLGIPGMVDALMKFFGYRGNLIYQLKNKRKPQLILAIVVLLPFAFIIETIGALNGKGGILRYYLRRKSKIIVD